MNMKMKLKKQQKAAAEEYTDKEAERLVNVMMEACKKRQSPT